MNSNILNPGKLSIRIENIQPILSVKDMTVSRHFYKDIFGFNEADWGTDDFTSVNRDQSGIYLCKGGQGNPGTWVWIGFDGDIAGFRFLTDPTFDPELMKGFCKCEQ